MLLLFLTRMVIQDYWSDYCVIYKSYLLGLEGFYSHFRLREIGIRHDWVSGTPVDNRPSNRKFFFLLTLSTNQCFIDFSVQDTLHFV